MLASKNYPGYKTIISHFDVGYQLKAIITLRAFMGKLKPFLQKVKTFDGLKNTAGIWTIHWNTGDIKSGVYFVKIKAGEFVKISEIVKVQ